MSRTWMSCFLITTILAGNQGRAQEQVEVDEMENVKKSLQFSLVNGTALYYWHPIRDSWTVRAGSDLSWSYRKDADRQTTYLQSHNNVETQSTTKDDYFYRSFTFSATLNLMRRLKLANTVDLFIGGGPVFSHFSSLSRNRQVDEESYSDQSRSKYRSNQNGIGALAVLSVQAAVHRRVALFAEYSLSYQRIREKLVNQYQYGPPEDDYFHQAKSRATFWRGQLSNLQLGVVARL